MPSAYSAANNVTLAAICSACRKTVPTALMVTLNGDENGRRTHNAVCLACAGKAGVQQVSMEFLSGCKASLG